MNLVHMPTETGSASDDDVDPYDTSIHTPISGMS
jgi:hypothetical protein